MYPADNIPEVSSKSERNLFWLAKLLLKIFITAACLWYVYTKINFTELKQVLGTISLSALLPVFLVFLIAKIFSTRRFDFFLRAIHIRLNIAENLKLFWLGMFYNLFLPGSITGDAYKVILLKKKFNAPYKKTMAAVLLDRFSGLLGLLVLLAMYSPFILENNIVVIVLIAGSVFTIVSFYFIIKKFFRDFIKIYWTSFFWGLLVQLLMVLCIEMLVKALGIETNPAPYVFVFLVAAVAGVLPLTVGGGLGIREFVFLEGAKYFNLDSHLAVAISLVFYFISLVASLPGIIFVFKPPLQRT